MRKVSPLLLAALTIIPLSMPVSAASVGGSTEEALAGMKTALLVLAGILAVAVVLCFITAANSGKRRKRPVSPGAAVIVYISTVLVLLVCLLCVNIYRDALTDRQTSLSDPAASDPVSDVQAFAPGTEATEVPTVEETVAPTEDPRLSFQPGKTDLSDPANWEVQWEIIENDEIVESYTRADPISFGEGSDYFALPGIATFRGNNYRNNATYGTAEVSSKTLTKVWSHGIGVYNGWGGCAWTGQPLVVQWDDGTKSIMNLYESKKTKDGLVEVIYATLDGYIHFYDLEDGSQTRDPIFMGMNFKGAGALDPRGYPLLYVGAGLYNGGKAPRMYVVSLIDGSILYEYGNNDAFAQRNWSAFDSSPLVDAETDTLIWPGENGLLYTIKLNTSYDQSAGTISVTPDAPVKTRYATAVSDERYLGYESSVSIVDHYLYVSENGGMFYCVDLNTMELVWAQDTKDDSNSSPVFEWGEDGNGYIYTAPSLHWTAEKSAGAVTIYKLNAQTGEIVWEYTRDCVTVTDVSGGVQATPLLGKEGTNIEGLVIYVIARTPSSYDGVMIAFDTETGEVVWEMDTKNYAWSSPAAFYTDSGEAYIAIANASGKVRLVDGATGEVLYALGFDQTTEASPVIFGNMMVLGTREGIYGIKIS
ncbi:MAG: PQQ-binding-like beta-propeller repeat protein [Oscillospiraceae bacterium]|nr:PQQ-binding-like beta-propeller repeat protein [Oscillospiraceae bacterium]